MGKNNIHQLARRKEIQRREDARKEAERKQLELEASEDEANGELSGDSEKPWEEMTREEQLQEIRDDLES